MAETCTGTFFSTAFVASTGTGGPPPPAPFLAVELSLREQPLKITVVTSTKALATNPARPVNNPGFEDDCFIATLILRVKRLWRIFARIPFVPFEKPRRTLPGR